MDEVGAFSYNRIICDRAYVLSRYMEDTVKLRLHVDTVRLHRNTFKCGSWRRDKCPVVDSEGWSTFLKKPHIDLLQYDGLRSWQPQSRCFEW